MIFLSKILVFVIIFIIGEFLFNFTWFAYLRKYFEKSVIAQEKEIKNENNNNDKKFLYLNISTFKGIMERFIISVFLISNFPPILIVFGTLKLGTRISEHKEIKNDYFLIGNLSSILVALIYFYAFKHFCI
ncbi:hypothetical protein ACNQGO_14020 [Flavobacterium sp. ZT3P35]|uniref:hypothetical protein n=1 Tax=Flavobacterium sp. ZT3P35 TaxID=3401727 RepID=UPI003AAB787C